MRFPRQAVLLALLTLAAACGQGGNASARPNTMLDSTTHDAFFPIAAGSKHALGSDSPAITCNSCHGGSNSFKQFDCLSCHQHQDQATLTAGHHGVSQFTYDSASCYSCHPRGTAGGALPPGGISDPAKSVTVNAEIPSYVDTSISSLSPRTETLPMPMLHASPNVAAVAIASCGNCHVNASMGAFYPGDLHTSLANLNLAQPSACVDCHASSMPTGFVGPTATNPARTPASSEMKHDAVLWSNGLPTKASAVPQDCAVCHVTPSMSMSATWANNRAGTTPALFHASLTAANQPQPASCVDCHANSRPTVLLSSANASLPANVSFDHSVAAALADCTSCHLNGGATQWTSWSGGQFHLVGSATPTSCLPCHASERPTSTSTWVMTTPQSSPFDYVLNSLNIGHGAGQDCVTCHAGPGIGGVWGGTGTSKQNWVGGYFTHGAGTISATTCFDCHATQRPDLVYGVTQAKSALPQNFDHSVNGTGDCFGCHQATVTKIPPSYVSYWNGTSAGANTSDWKGGMGYPGAVLIGAPNQFITTTETTLHRSGTNNLVTSMSSINATLNNAMLHTSTAVPWILGTGPDYTQCYHCHTVSNTANGSPYANGQFHSALTTQPAGQCADCHAQMRPTGIVQMAGSDLQPMDHYAKFVSAVTISGKSVSSVDQIDCTTCHSHPGSKTPGWGDGIFHANIGGAVPADCTTCHYPLMADAAKSDLSSALLFTMKHTSSQLTFQNCQLCHANALLKGAITPDVSTLWQPGAFHASLASQPTACLTCHAISEPVANASTQSSWSYTFANGGGTSSNQFQWLNHGAADVSGKDCFTCHAADAKQSGSAWSKATYFHSVVTSPTACQTCHGLTNNGGGSVAGTNNNLPAGLTNSSTLTMASNDASTGVPVGTHDQINHAEVNVSSHDCNFCHTQAGISTMAGVQGQEWAQASFHAHFTGTPLVLNATTGRCSNCHMNVKPGSGFTTDHSSFTSTSGSEDCATCHFYPGTGTPSSPNWYGASGEPAFINVGGFTIPVPPAAAANTIQLGISNLPHPTVTAPTTCSSCHTGGVGGKDAIGYDHASTLASANCASCHEAGTNLVGLPWNGVTAQASGAGDSRPFTLASLKPSICGTTIATPGPHFYPSDCSLCHNPPTGNVTTTTGAAYTAAWKGHHPPKTGSTSSPPCSICHKNGCN